MTVRPVQITVELQKEGQFEREGKNFLQFEVAAVKEGEIYVKFK